MLITTVEILSTTDWHQFWTKSVGAVAENVFCENQPHGGATTGLCEKCGAEVQRCHPGSVCAKFDCDQANGHTDRGENSLRVQTTMWETE